MMKALKILFAPGAGAPSSSRWMRHWASLLGELGTVTCFDYPYQVDKRRRPDRLEVLLQAHALALEKMRKRSRGPMVLAGKSMGSRIGCLVSMDHPVDAIICLGYPLRSPKGVLRDAPLLQLQAPALLVSGTRDPFCPVP